MSLGLGEGPLKLPQRRRFLNRGRRLSERMDLRTERAEDWRVGSADRQQPQGCNGPDRSDLVPWKVPTLTRPHPADD